MCIALQVLSYKEKEEQTGGTERNGGGGKRSAHDNRRRAIGDKKFCLLVFVLMRLTLNRRRIEELSPHVNVLRYHATRSGPRSQPLETSAPARPGWRRQMPTGDGEPLHGRVLEIGRAHV